MTAVTLSRLTLLATFSYYMNRYVLKHANLNLAKTKKKKVKIGLRASAKFLLDSKYIRDLAALVISYGMYINIIEVS